MNDKRGLISVIVPVYNVERYLSRCVESLLAQTYKNVEILLIDDDSQDKCPQLCDDYVKNYSNIKTIHLKNSGIGVSGARNAGLDNAKGDFIAFVDSDDYVHCELFYQLHNLLEKQPIANMAMCSYQKVNEETKSFEGVKVCNEILLDDLGAMNLIIEDQNKTAVWSKLYKKSIFENLRFPVGKHNEDMFLMPFIFQNAKNIAYCPYPLYYYFQDNESLCRSAFNYNMLDMLDALSIWNERVASDYPNLLKKAKSHYYTAVISSCQYLADKNDTIGMDKFFYYQQIINTDFFYIFSSDYISLNNKFKLILFKSKLFRPFFRLLNTLNIKKYK
jgi:glycosyltransferase involved in cell wall biosynthesis